MTQNQIAYWSFKENQRHNVAGEQENYRHNVTYEGETQRHNTATEYLEGIGQSTKQREADIKQQQLGIEAGKVQASMLSAQAAAQKASTEAYLAPYQAEKYAKETEKLGKDVKYADAEHVADLVNIGVKTLGGLGDVIGRTYAGIKTKGATEILRNYGSTARKSLKTDIK